jgi:hypothetical protein
MRAPPNARPSPNPKLDCVLTPLFERSVAPVCEPLRAIETRRETFRFRPPGRPCLSHQQERREASTWLSKIITQGRELELLLRDSPTLRHLLECDTELRPCPFTIDQTLDEDFLP